MIHEGPEYTSNNSVTLETDIAYLAVAPTQISEEDQEYFNPQHAAEKSLLKILSKQGKAIMYIFNWGLLFVNSGKSGYGGKWGDISS